MFERMAIKNFRVFRELNVEKLGPINLFTGENNVGKTTLLEAMFLLSGAGNPEMAINANVLRGWVNGNGVPAGAPLWRELFAGLDIGKAITLAATHRSLGELLLEVEPGPPQELTSITPTNGNGNPPSATTNVPDERSLSFAFSRQGEQVAQGSIRLSGSGLKMSRPMVDVPFPATILVSRSGSAQEDAGHLGRLRRKKRGDLLLEALRIVEPKLQSIEENSASGTPMIWGDLGLPELVPLPVMGEGMTRIARIVLAISSTPNGLVLVDEIETGLHHSVLEKFWRVVETAARQFDTQVFATTHSFECVQAAHQALADPAGATGAGEAVCNDAFCLHRLDLLDNEFRCITYSAEAIAGAIEHGLDVR